MTDNLHSSGYKSSSFFVFCFSLLGLFLCYKRRFLAYPNLCLFLVSVRENLDTFPQCKMKSTNLAHANCTPFFSPKHLGFVTEKNSFFCHVENTVFQTLPKNAFFIRFAHFLLFLGGSNNHSSVQNQRAYPSFSPKKKFVG